MSTGHVTFRPLTIAVVLVCPLKVSRRVLQIMYIKGSILSAINSSLFSCRMQNGLVKKANLKTKYMNSCREIYKIFSEENLYCWMLVELLKSIMQ